MPDSRCTIRASPSRNTGRREAHAVGHASRTPRARPPSACRSCPKLRSLEAVPARRARRGSGPCRASPAQPRRWRGTGPAPNSGRAAWTSSLPQSSGSVSTPHWSTPAALTRSSTAPARAGEAASAADRASAEAAEGEHGRLHRGVVFRRCAKGSGVGPTPRWRIPVWTDQGVQVPEVGVPGVWVGRGLKSAGAGSIGVPLTCNRSA